MEHLPRISRPENGGAITFGPNYTDVAQLLQDVQEGMQEYPQAELSVFDEPHIGCLGFEIYVVEKDEARWWHFLIHAKDLKRCLEAPDAPAEWQALRTTQGRVGMLEALKLGRPEIVRLRDAP